MNKTSKHQFVSADQETIAKLRAANKKLRAANKKLRVELERVRDKCHEHWNHAEIAVQERHEQYLIAQTWQQAHRQLCEGLGARK